MAFLRPRLRVNHFDHIRDRWVLTHRGAHDLDVRRVLEPIGDMTLGPRAERLAAHRARTHDLHEAAQHLAIVDHAPERLGEVLRLQGRQKRDEQGRHVLHMPFLTRINRRFGDEGRIDVERRQQRVVELTLRIHVEGVVQRSRRGELRESVARGPRIGAAARFIPRIRSRKQLSDDGCEQGFARHGSVPSHCDRAFIATSVPEGPRQRSVVSTYSYYMKISCRR
jgi:hypothetical protein